MVCDGSGDVAVSAALEETLEWALGRVATPFQVGNRDGRPQVLEVDGKTVDGSAGPRPSEGVSRSSVAFVPATRLEHLGDPSFLADHGIRLPYVSGAMANGIASVQIVEAMSRAGMLGFFGAAGLALERVESAINGVRQRLGPTGSHGFNLIHSPSEPELEAAVADLYLRRGVRLVEASAYLDLTLPLVRYRLSGLRKVDGRIEPANRVMAKVSRVEVASKFLSPAPARFVAELVARGELTEEQAVWSEQVPMADDLTAEADSGGHTDNQPAVVLLPTLIALRDRLAREKPGRQPWVRVGAAGGIATPWSAAAAFAMGAAYIVGGSVHQSCVEAGTSETVRGLLCQARQGDVAMAPAADMFEMGVRVQVLKRGTMFPMRASKLYELYRTHASIEDIPPSERASLEKSIFRASLDEVWSQTRAFFMQRDPSQLDRAASDPKHKMALIFRWYLGLSSTWANRGEPDRVLDYQIWCGPAMAAFNEWVKGSFLEGPRQRHVATVALNLLYGAAVLGRARFLTSQGFTLPPGCPRLSPLDPLEIHQRLDGAR